LKVELPAGAQLVTAEVEGEPVRPVAGTDGSRVPLLRANLDSSKAYNVSFVYLSSGSRFGKTGSYDMGLPRFDIPVNLLTWEVLLPDRLDVKQFGGNAFAAELFPSAAQNILIEGADDKDYEANFWNTSDISTLEAGQIGGIVVDPNGAIVANASITATNTQTGATLTTRSDGEGHWVISGMQPGPVKVTIASPGFRNVQQDLELQASTPFRMGTTLQVGGVAESVTVTDSRGLLNISPGTIRGLEDNAKKNQAAQLNAPSQNVFNLQRRVAGILPVRIEVPRSGKSYRFVRPLVLDEETRISFQYKSR
jgi:carboxypeptidase family protein